MRSSWCRDACCVALLQDYMLAAVQRPELFEKDAERREVMSLCRVM